MLPYNLSQFPTSCQPPLLAIDRLRFGLAAQMGHPSFQPFPGLEHSMMPFRALDPRARFIQEEPKPQHSYIGLIAMAILSSTDKKLVLSDIYQWIQDNYPYFRTRGPGWRNSIRHNLSLNDCFIKSGRSANGKGHYWAIHAANVEDFKKCDFRRRRAQRKARKAMGYQVQDDEDDEDSPCVSPKGVPLPSQSIEGTRLPVQPNPGVLLQGTFNHPPFPSFGPTRSTSQLVTTSDKNTQKRRFDIESILAPEPKSRKQDESANMHAFPVFPGFPFPNPFLVDPANPVLGLNPSIQGESKPKNEGPGTVEDATVKSGAFQMSPNSTKKWQEAFAGIIGQSYKTKDSERNDDV